MLRKMTMILMSVVVLTTTIYTKDSNAIVGIIAKSKVQKTVGGVATAAGVTIAGSTLLYGVAANSLSGAVIAIIGVYVGAITAGIGLIILDDKTIAELSFNKVYPGEFDNLTEEEIIIYNRELQMLNSIKETIARELPDDTTLEEAGDVWKAYSGMLSPETMQVAGKVSERFLAQ